MILITAPMKKEYHCGREVFSLREEQPDDPRFRVCSGTLKDDICLLQTGPDVEAALDWFFSFRGRPSLIVDSGSCGSLNPELPVGRILFGSVIRDQSGKEIRADHVLPADVCEGRLLEVSRGIHSSVERDSLSSLADGCVMESFRIAQEARTLNIPWLSFRVVTDSADENSREDFKANLRPCCMNLYRFLKEFLINRSH